MENNDRNTVTGIYPCIGKITISVDLCKSAKTAHVGSRSNKVIEIANKINKLTNMLLSDLCESYGVDNPIGFKELQEQQGKLFVESVENKETIVQTVSIQDIIKQTLDFVLSMSNKRLDHSRNLLPFSIGTEFGSTFHTSEAIKHRIDILQPGEGIIVVYDPPTDTAPIPDRHPKWAQNDCTMNKTKTLTDR